MSGRVVGNDVGWVAFCAAAGAAVSAIQPVHVLAVIVPDAEYQDHAAAQSLSHGGETTVS